MAGENPQMFAAVFDENPHSRALPSPFQAQGLAFARSYSARVAIIKYVRTRKSVGARFLLFTLLADNNEAEVIHKSAPQRRSGSLNVLALLCLHSLGMIVIVGARQFFNAAFRGIIADEAPGTLSLRRMSRSRQRFRRRS
jgi:hypothetical protein